MKLYTEIEEKIKDLKAIQNYINVYFQQTLSLIQQKSNKAKNHLKDVAFVKQIFTDIEKTYKVKSFFYKGHKKSETKPIIYVYISENLKLSGLSSKQIDDHLKSVIQPHDFFIAIGKNAIKFVEKNKVNTILKIEKNGVEHARNLKTIIYEYFLTGKVGKIKFVLHSSKIKNNQVTLLPAEEFNLRADFEYDKTNIIQESKIYPNLQTFLETLNVIYIDNAIYSLIIEADFFALKQRLTKLQNNINEIEKKLMLAEFDLNKAKSQILNEDIILATQNNEDE